MPTALLNVYHYVSTYYYYYYCYYKLMTVQSLYVLPTGNCRISKWELRQRNLVVRKDSKEYLKL